jgi:hypothetical protein
MGKETAGGWEAAFASYGSSLDNVHALVCDGCVGLTRQAHIRGWVLQRCQFHLWHGLNNYLRIPRQGSPQNHAIRVHRLIRIVLESPEDKLAEQAVEELRAVLPLLSSRGAHKVVRGFVGHWRNYRSFISYPYLNLPRTSNCAEQGVCLIRRLQQSARGWNSYPALEAWAETVIKHKRTVTCKPSLPTKLI